MKNSDKIIQKIRSNQIKPIPKAWFVFRKILLWFGFLFFIGIGAISFSVILYTVKENSFDLFTHINHSKLEFILVIFPVLWLTSLVIFLMASMWTMKYSERGYKKSPGKWLTLSTGLSLVLGTLFFISGGAQWFETSFANSVEIYESIEEKKIDIWSQPEEGLMSGTIEKVNTKSLEIIDFAGQTWEIFYSEAFIAPIVLLEPGEKIKINGKKIDQNKFRASDIRPWGGKNYRFPNKSERKGKGMRNRG